MCVWVALVSLGEPVCSLLPRSPHPLSLLPARHRRRCHHRRPGPPQHGPAPGDQDGLQEHHRQGRRPLRPPRTSRGREAGPLPVSIPAVALCSPERILALFKDVLGGKKPKTVSAGSVRCPWAGVTSGGSWCLPTRPLAGTQSLSGLRRHPWEHLP